MKSEKLLVILLFSFFWLAVGCAPTAPKKEAAAVPPPSFDFTPPSQAAPASAGVILALVSPSYAEAEKYAIFSRYPFQDFCNNMKQDFDELLVARGFTLTGPYESYEAMTFPEKNGCDLVLTPSLQVKVDFTNTSCKEQFVFLGPKEYKQEGQATVTGRIYLYMYESLSGEKMWTKSIDLPMATRAVAWAGERTYTQPTTEVDAGDPGLGKALGPVLSSAYSAVMDAAWKYLDPGEIQMVKKEAMIVKEKKRY